MTTLDGPERPADRPIRPETHEMTEAEKRMAEWEARHDVAARGHRAAPDVLQHYLAHERLTHAEPRPAQPSLPAPDEPAVGSGREPEVERPRGWLRRLLRR